MKALFLLIAIIFAGAIVGYAQSPCPTDMVCISRSAALKALTDSDTVKAQATQIDTLTKALADEKDLLNQMRIEFAAKSGENTALKENAVSDRAIMTVLSTNCKARSRIGLLVF